MISNFYLYLRDLTIIPILQSSRLLIPFLFWFGSVVQAQEIRSLSFAGTVIIPHEEKLGNSRIGGLSGITYDPGSDRFLLVADKPPARLFTARIIYTDTLQVHFEKVTKLTPSLLLQSEMEGIAYNPARHNFIVSDEQTTGTRIFILDLNGRFSSIIEPVNQGLLPLSNHNSGIEGLTISDDGSTLFYAFEKPTLDCQDKGLVQISRLSLANHHRQDFRYRLHPVANDKIPTNGISEILYLNDSSLLVMERAYIPGEGNVVRLYRASLPKTSNSVTTSEPIKTTLLFDFATIRSFNIDNAEGMTFSADKSLLLIVTDNNFSKKQQTQIVVLTVSY